MTKFEDAISNIVVEAVHIYCRENELPTPHFVGLFLGDKLAMTHSEELLELAKKEIKDI